MGHSTSFSIPCSPVSPSGDVMNEALDRGCSYLIAAGAHGFSRSYPLVVRALSCPSAGAWSRLSSRLRAAASVVAGVAVR